MTRSDGAPGNDLLILELHMTETPIDKAIRLAGGVTALGERMGLSPQVVSNWRARGVPAERCPALEHITAGAVRCEDLRPDISWGVLRTFEKE